MGKITKITLHSHLVLVCLMVLLILMAIPAYFWMKDTNKSLAAQHNSRMSPVIMVPGSSATQNRFNPLIKKINEDSPKKHSVLRLKVKNNGEITSEGWINRGDNEPIIVIGFENNHDGYQNIKKQAKMVNQVIERLTEEYNFNNFKAFGHSNGGLVWTYWLEHYYTEYKDTIIIKKLMTLGTPYNFAESSVNHPTQMFSDFVKYRNQIPKNLLVYSVAGTETYTSDGLVPEGSVDAGKYIYQKQVAHYTSMTVTGKDAQHSNLPENKQVVRLIEEYLLDLNDNGNPNSQNKQGTTQS
ncbi:alpha/beta hydrolase [Limosilactobacillus agrestis]|uniref:Alpha/beta hydrolase n=1 Tax=Limosilactobacillus agrestis TaxID=2759748 RepID=A0A7W3UG11_9LACO|nr:alpha/beta hydrolase [Limosilactobacillus agrestis]MBB1094704.1 alpha/beta hydrolase [Limosilactobacillus agrestis]MCD7130692.1 alpha/beta hydrolase [Limosilactobacillus agrestis]